MWHWPVLCEEQTLGTAGDAAGGGPADAGQASPLMSGLLVGATLRRLREEQGLSWRDAGEAIGAPVSAIGRLERGQAGYRMRDMVGLCTLYGVNDQEQRASCWA